MGSGTGGQSSDMTGLIIILLLLAALGILGAVVKGLLWLTLIAAIAFVAASIWGWTKLKSAVR